LLGGEPLLHPDINILLDISRQYFNKGLITIVTNGILLLKQPVDFWESCNRNNIEIWITKYPIKLDIVAIKNTGKKHGVLVRYFDEEIKSMWKIPLDVNGTQDVKWNFKNCVEANWCISLEDGRLSTCSRISYIRHFNKYFNMEFPVSGEDYIDIYKAKNMDEIFAFLCKPAPFCRFCNIKGKVPDLKWGISKKDITEWV
jgi:hypothetical protein